MTQLVSGESGLATWFIVVDDAPTSEAEAGRTAVVAELRETATARAMWKHDRWIDVDIRAVVVGAAQLVSQTPADNPALRWVEPNATLEAASRFVDAVASAVASLPRAERSADVLAAIETGRERLGLTADLQGAGSVVIVVPEWTNVPALQAEPALSLSSIVPSDELEPTVNGRYHPWWWCPPSAIEGCSVRVHLIAGTCDPARGLRPSGSIDDSEYDLGLPVTCDVLHLEGEAGLRCEDRTENGRSLPGGFCIARDRLCPHPVVRIVGGAMPSRALTEVVCNLE